MNTPQKRVDIYSDKVPWYPNKVVNLNIIRGLALKTGDSLSTTVDKLLNNEISKLPVREREELTARGREWDNKYAKKALK